MEGIFSRFERDELNKITAKSILEKLMNTRQNINVEFTARRLIWELIQNAKDNVGLCNNIEEKLDITIELEENQFIFSHTKGYFTNQHIRGLIRKYSSSDKDRDTEEIGEKHKATGRFGTGFMTTHLLSEKVKVESYYKNEDSSYCRFNFWLDRSGRGEKEIIIGINQAFDEAEENIRKSYKVLLANNDFKTTFTYPLKEQKKKLAYITLEEVKKGVAYTLINLPQINSITIVEELVGSTVYQIKLINTKVYEEKEFRTYNLIIDGKMSKKSFLCVYDDEVQIVIPTTYNQDDVYYALNLDSKIPRLHLDFPMIGTEDLNLPFIINCPLFEPTEPRDGISLIDDEDNEVSKINCNMVIQAVNLYNLFLSYIGENKNWNNLYNLARIKIPKKHLWIDLEWFRDNVVIPIQQKLLSTPIVDVVNGERVSILNENDEHQVFFPYSVKTAVREKIWELSKTIYPENIPKKESIDYWNEIIWNDCYKFSISELSKEIEESENINNLAGLIDEQENNVIDFLNGYYDLLNFEQDHVKDIISDKFKVIPNQNGDFTYKSKIYLDDSIDEELKNVLTLISEDPKIYLRDKSIKTASNYSDIESKILYSQKKQDDIVNEINNILKEDKNLKISDACDYLASLFINDSFSEKRNSIFEFSKKVYPEDFNCKRKLENYNEKIWEESDKKSISYIVFKISECKTVQEAVQHLNFKDEEAFINWLDSLISFLVNQKFENNINREKHPILPNQNGVFSIKDNLFLDSGNIGDILKDISAELGYDFRDELLNSSIFLKLPENRVYDIDDVAEKISSFIKPILRDIDKRKQNIDTLKKFYLWMNDNKEIAETNFSDLFEKRFLFLEDDDISRNMKKATEFDQLMQEHGIDNIDELRTRLSQIVNVTNFSLDNKETEKVNITKEILVSLGISSPIELEDAFKDPLIASRFYHTSTPTTEMFIYAQGLVERAKINVIEFLENHPDYDCTDLEETAPTTLVGIIKNQSAIQIVVRPSDNGEVIVYYSSEKDTLDSDNSELWVDNGISEPHILTLGRILKSTGINRIPINMK